jgi:3-dehydrosphinganine reductase
MTSAGPQKVAVISGGSSGIGLECARILCLRGYQVTLLARDDARLESARRSIKDDTGSEVAIRRLDVGDAQGCETAIADIAGATGKIDWLITCAGMVEPGLFGALPLESHRRQMETNYFGTLNLVAPTARIMASQGGGRITMIASGAAFVGIAGYSAYAPGKFAVRALGEVLRVELEPQGVCVSVAFPPDTDTPQLAEEQKARPQITRLLAAGAGVLPASHVAERMIRDAEAGRFMLTASKLMTAFGWAHSLYAPFFRKKQIRLMRELEKSISGRP